MKVSHWSLSSTKENGYFLMKILFAPKWVQISENFIFSVSKVKKSNLDWANHCVVQFPILKSGVANLPDPTNHSLSI